MLEVSDLSVTRGGVKLLEGVSFKLAAGQALVLRGPNGVGKTSLLRTVAGLQPALGGAIQFEPDGFAYASHADGIKATLSVEENLTFWAQIFGSNGVEAAMMAYDLRTLRERPAGALSAGQGRRLGLARLLVTGRPLWLLDEPTVSLDAEAVGMFARAIKAHLQAGGAALLATHIDLGLEDPTVLELSPYKAKTPVTDDFDEAFL
ncbi:Cytochrome c biogenesis ATP-binding export protein CcmA [Roseovarius albus]|uniref:Cytochrome c biogenesis ATP-binding export protein CcmA n=2 Tax=Roseovarius albus TaxID=1247867 RepID=A0A1X6YB18_9RHOB|nr:Cytochrome c biogenesis ATP-binding export protein CcmA [Roseovarius albus]